MQQVNAAIVANRVIAPSWRELVLEWDTAGSRPSPGQFFTFRASASTDPLLRRPLAFASAGSGRVSAIYQIRGSATTLLSELSPGSRLDVLGPLGRPFPAPALIEGSPERPLLAAGGIGVGPILFLAAELLRSAPVLVLGFRGAGALPDLELPPSAILCTDDGSRGFHGTVADWLRTQAPPLPARLYACGPAPMLAALAALAPAKGWAASFSAEQWMACGVGACMGCALPRADGLGYLRACSDGPVFEGRDIDWAGEADRA